MKTIKYGVTLGLVMRWLKEYKRLHDAGEFVLAEKAWSDFETYTEVHRQQRRHAGYLRYAHIKIAPWPGPIEKKIHA